MLVLTRKQGEKLVIGRGPEAVTILVVRTDKGKVRLGIEANADTEVHRKEVYDRLHADALEIKAA